MSLHQDPAGRLDVVYPRQDAGGYHAQYAVSDDGVTWTSAELWGEPFTQPGDMRVAAAPDHVGVAVWEYGTRVMVALVPPPAVRPPDQPLPPPPPPVPGPRFNQGVLVVPSGSVFVRLKGSSRFVRLTEIDDVPFGATIDTRRGAVILNAQTRRGAPIEVIRLSDGMFKLSQSGKVVNFTLNEPLAACPERGSAAQKKAKSRKLWGDGKGKFRTKGRYAAATVRGTRWLVSDTCTSTKVTVRQGSVSVRDDVRKRTAIVRKGKSYTARRR
jgi:hypothetical protein